VLFLWLYRAIVNTDRPARVKLCRELIGSGGWRGKPNNKREGETKRLWLVLRRLVYRLIAPFSRAEAGRPQDRFPVFPHLVGSGRVMSEQAVITSEVAGRLKPRAQWFTMQLPLRYRVRSENTWRRGETINVSSSEVLFRV
jgi:hypothetical protein